MYSSNYPTNLIESIWYLLRTKQTMTLNDLYSILQNHENYMMNNIYKPKIYYCSLVYLMDDGYLYNNINNFLNVVLDNKYLLNVLKNPMYNHYELTPHTYNNIINFYKSQINTLIDKIIHHCHHNGFMHELNIDYEISLMTLTLKRTINRGKYYGFEQVLQSPFL
jgi:hypothetical protein